MTAGPSGLISWIRVGACNGCGDCCRSGDPFNGTEGQPVVEGACVKLAPGPDGTFRCVDHGDPASFWARGCHIWPTLPCHVEAYARCSYSWVEL